MVNRPPLHPPAEKPAREQRRRYAASQLPDDEERHALR